MRLRFLLLFCLICTINFAQNVITPTSEWVKIDVNETDLKDIIIYKRDVSIVDKSNGRDDVYVQYRFKNQSNNDLFINWNFIRSYINFHKTEVPNEENYRAIHLKGQQDFIPDFHISNQDLFFVFKAFKNNRSNTKLIECKLDNLKVKLL